MSWQLTAVDGQVFDESQCLWPDLPADLVISALRIGDDVVSGFQAYGFQRYAQLVPGLGTLGRGYQLLTLAGDWLVVTDVDELSGRREVRCQPRATMTYAPALLRAGG